MGPGRPRGRQRRRRTRRRVVRGGRARDCRSSIPRDPAAPGRGGGAPPRHGVIGRQAARGQERRGELVAKRHDCVVGRRTHPQPLETEGVAEVGRLGREHRCSSLRRHAADQVRHRSPAGKGSRTPDLATNGDGVRACTAGSDPGDLTLEAGLAVARHVQRVRCRSRDDPGGTEPSPSDHGHRDGQRPSEPGPGDGHRWFVARQEPE
jgi:hypothetical protein